MTRNSDTLTLRLPAGTPAARLPVPEGRWHRGGDGSIVASYRRGNGDGDSDELAVALWVWEAVYQDEERSE